MKVRISILLLCLLFFYVLNAFLNPFPTRSSPEGFSSKYGFSYSFSQAKWFGYDGRKEFVWLLDNYKFSWVRLTFFWDEMADDSGNLKIDDLTFAIGEAKKRNVDVIIALGAKVPYYPEYHLPSSEWAKVKFGERIGLNSRLAPDLLAVDKKLVDALWVYDNISYWQVENEPFLANVNNMKIMPDLLAAEVAAVRAADPLKRPIILNSDGPSFFNSQWKNVFDILKPGDVFGISTYFKIQGTNLFAFSAFGKNIKVPWPKPLSWPVQSWYFLSPDLNYVKNYAQGRGFDFWVLETQAEPYIRVIEDAGKNNGDYEFKPGDIQRVANYFNSFRVSNVGLWGANFWLYKKSVGDFSWTNEVKQVVN